MRADRKEEANWTAGQNVQLAVRQVGIFRWGLELMDAEKHKKEAQI